MSRIALDSVKYANLKGLRWPHLIGYANGRISAWTDQEQAEARSRGQLLALVDVLGTAPHLGSILDWERGDVQSPAVVHRWVQARNQFRADATVYVQPPKIRTIVNAVGREPCNLFVVDLTADGEPPFGLPDYGPLPANVRVIARQFVFGPRSGGNYDMSVIYADDWHPDQAHPANYAPVRLAAAAELGVSGSLQWAANVPTEPDPAAAAGPVAITTLADVDVQAAEPGAAEVMPRGYSAALASGLLGADVGESAPGTGPLATITPLITAADVVPDPVLLSAERRRELELELEQLLAAELAADQRAAELDQAGLSSGSDSPRTQSGAVGQGVTAMAPATGADHGPGGSGSDDLAAFRAAAAPVPVIGNDQAAAVPSSSSGPAAADVATAAAGSDATAAAAAALPTLNHEFIRATLADVGEVARQLRGHGLETVAGHLEQAAAIAWEVGSALKSAGL